MHRHRNNAKGNREIKMDVAFFVLGFGVGALAISYTTNKNDDKIDSHKYVSHCEKDDNLLITFDVDGKERRYFGKDTKWRNFENFRTISVVEQSELVYFLRDTQDMIEFRKNNE